MRASRVLLSVARVADFDIGGPLITYSLLRSAEVSSLIALIASGAFPAPGVAIGMIGHRRAKVIPLAVTAVLTLWTVAYSLVQRRKGMRLAAAGEREHARSAGPDGVTGRARRPCPGR
jgi:hypothetical protein